MESNLQWAKRVKGMKTGVTVTCRINDATPADFCIYGPTRKDEEGLAVQYLDANVDFISGGGTHFWDQRSDGRNLIEEMKAKGYTYVDKLEDIAGAQGDKFLGLYDEYDLKPSLDRGPILMESTMKALKMLDNKNTLKVKLRRAQSGDLNAGYVDWNPRPVDESMGIIRPVTLISTPDVEVKDIFVKPIIDTKDLSKASFEAKVTLVNLGKKAVKGTVEGVYEGGKFSVPVSLAAGETKIVSVVENVENPRIWWTAEMGSPELYHLNVAFCKGKKVSHSSAATFGLRSIESEITPYGHRQFILNGQKVLVKPSSGRTASSRWSASPRTGRPTSSSASSTRTIIWSCSGRRAWWSWRRTTSPCSRTFRISPPTITRWASWRPSVS